jgi:hypothetical protein
MSKAGGNRVLVVGGTRGTGCLIARLLHERGYDVRVLARDPARASAELGSAFEVVAGDLTKADTLPPVLRDVDHIIFTAGAPSGRYASENLVKTTDYDGVIDTLAAARSAGFRGRFVYLNSIGIKTHSLAGFLINLLKRNTLVWRRRVEDKIRSSGLDNTIIRVGFLLDRPGGERAVNVSQGTLPLAFRNRIAAQMLPKRSLKRCSILARHARHSKSCGAKVCGGEAGAPFSRTSTWSDRSSASDRIMASVAGDLPGVSRAIWTAPREAERTRRACGIRTP